MPNFIYNLENFTTHRGLRCVWVQVRDGERTRLEARWIDSRAATREATIDPDPTRPPQGWEALVRFSLQFSWDSAPSSAPSAKGIAMSGVTSLS